MEAGRQAAILQAMQNLNDVDFRGNTNTTTVVQPVQVDNSYFHPAPVVVPPPSYIPASR